MLGVAVIALAVLVATGRLGRGTATGPSREEQRSGADRFGNRLFVPALTVPVVIIVAVGLKIHIGDRPFLEKDSETLIGLGVAAIVSVVIRVRTDQGADPHRDPAAGLRHRADVLPRVLIGGR